MKKKWVPKDYSYLQCDEMADWLGRMASKGWRFSRFRLGFLFEECEPAEDVYDVQTFLKNQENDLSPNEDTMDFAQFCAAAGWQFIDSKSRFAVFRQVRKDAIPIFTPQEKLDAAFCAEIKKLLLMLPAVIWFAVYILYFQFWTDFSLLHSFLRLFDTGSLMLIALCTLWLASVSGFILYTLWWRRRKQKKLEKEGAFSCKTGRLSAMASAAVSALTALLLAGISILLIRSGSTGNVHLTWKIVLWLVLLAGVSGSLFRDEWQRPNRKEQERRQSVRFILLIFVLAAVIPWIENALSSPGNLNAGKASESVPPLVLTDIVQDLDGLDTVGYDMYAKNNILGSCLHYSLYCPTPGFSERLREWEENQIGKTEEEIGEGPVDDGFAYLEWELCRTPYRRLAGFVWDRRKAPVRTGDFREQKTIPEKDRWEALEAWSAEDSGSFSYCVLYDSAGERGRQREYSILYIESSEPLDDEQVSLVREKLGL